MRAVTNTLAPSLGEEGTKTIEDLKRQMVLMEKENIKLFNKEKHISKKMPKKTLQNRKYLEVVFQITIDNLKQIKKDEAIQNFLMEIKKIQT